MAKVTEIKRKCDMGALFPMVDSLKDCDKEGEIMSGDHLGKEIWLCPTHSHIFWGFFVLPDIIKQQMSKGGVEDG